MQFNIAIGDWSDDGHGECKDYLCSADATIEMLREAYFKLEDILGFKLCEVCGEYGEEYMNPVHAERLFELGIISESMYNNIESDDPDTITAGDMVNIVIACLNMVNPDLNVKHDKPQAKIPDLHFYGYDSQGRHINFIGYGVLGND